ncbi:MAG TPA: opioid growth factor receptor-related protein [Geminicoccus sp.]|uniref:opioid growth factor receptor-related protein n=1 Tax=Geminicoccus sp. TaxID=2024832 RepID=UPI002E3683B4|nr:opioid growth factor receptor-related protein [Geminicoccus sp.]HEX2529454.1 opioid growth factor receptor-related protein [Geminicoccus sp.]
MEQAIVGPLHAYLAGIGRDGKGRTLYDVLDLPNVPLEYIHDYIQWLFPLPVPSSAQPTAPVLTEAEIQAIRIDPRCQANLDRAGQRMLAFYRQTRGWLRKSDHNHLRITRIIQSLRLLVGDEAAQAFHDEVVALVEEAGAPVDPANQRYWTRALED